ncbi:MAG: Phosphinothricin N-acetyltransferase [Frankiales bacterium]|nr:Phosphinothricin N-acetyltransferase [Frankiales bacterium]
MSAGSSPAAVRAAVPGDAAAIAAVYAPWVSDAVASFEAVPPDAEETARRMVARPRLPWLVAERDGVVVGFAHASPHRSRAAYRWAVDTSVYLAASETGRGTGRALYGVLLPLLRDLGLVTVHAGITLPNPASVGLHEALGFTPVGVYRDVGFKAGAWHDVGWWRLALGDPPAVPEEPREWPG